MAEVMPTFGAGSSPTSAASGGTSSLNSSGTYYNVGGFPVKNDTANFNYNKWSDSTTANFKLGTGTMVVLGVIAIVLGIAYLKSKK